MKNRRIKVEGFVFLNMQMESKKRSRVCVTGGGGYIGSALVHSLLQCGYTVHATLRNLGDESKVGLLRGFPYAEDELHLFEANMYKPEEFEEAIQGCVFVFHVATPLLHTTGYKYNDMVEATISAAKEIADICIRSRTVKRLIYTASVVAASPLKDNGSGYNITIDESCWTPLHLNVPYNNNYRKDYTESKTKAEQVILKIGEEKASELEVVTLGCRLVGGRGHLPYAPDSLLVLISQIINHSTHYESLKYLEELLGKIPIVHIEDTCRAHIFSAETPSVNGRFLCASSYISTAEIAKYFQENYPQFHLKQEYFEEQMRDTKWGSHKLEDYGFGYKYNMKTILDDSLKCASVSKTLQSMSN
ncbi:unnamed protein product [Lactuca saligna]|uniref:NAD-dependent epimerase/dehydratase domain-containing protein n=1 Tax=Lactuca saligna TaxID=75948 RepID=A0AA35Z0N9_LACSI|nr:unnamed protein product [Lactuca saligna]